MCSDVYSVQHVLCVWESDVICVDMWCVCVCVYMCDVCVHVCCVCVCVCVIYKETVVCSSMFGICFNNNVMNKRNSNMQFGSFQQ